MRLGHGGYASRKQNQCQPYQGCWNHQQKASRSTSTDQESDVLAWCSFGMMNHRERGKEPAQVAATPSPLRENNTNDN